jgi:hypothetical protein
MSNETSEKNTVKRRGFFATLGLGGAAAVVAAVSEPKQAEAFTPTKAKGGSHYTESEHIKQFYKVNRY